MVKSVLYVAFLTALLILVVIIGPFLAIWSLNTLFSLAIPFTLETWAAAAILSSILSGGLVSSSKNNA